MSLKASSLKSNEAQKKAINREISNILASMDESIKTAHEQGRHDVQTSLPIQFSVAYMSNKDAQRFIYYRILKSLLEREFMVEIDMNINSTIFYITWISKDEKEDLELQTSVLAQHTRKSQPNTTI